MRQSSKNNQERTRKRIVKDSLLTIIILLVASLLCEGLYQLSVGEQNIIIVMVLAVFIIAAITDGYVFGLVATVVGVFIYDFLVTQPRLGFSFTMGFPITLSIMLLVTVATSTITTRIKKQAKTAREKEARAELLYDINRKLLSSRDEGTVALHAMAYLADDLGRSVALFTKFYDQGSPAFYFRGVEGDASSDLFSTPAEWSAAQQASKRSEPTGAGTSAHRQATGYYIPVVDQGTVYGVFGISCQNGPLPTANMAFVKLIVGQTAQALRVMTLATRKQEALVMAETEKARNSFLRGISHDLRTPLTSIIGASATFLESREGLPVATQMQLVEDIHADAQWLLSMVENILSITRIQQNSMVIQKTEEAAEEVVAEAVALFRRRSPQAEVVITPPDDLLLVPMDALLITQVITNLLDNSLRHSDGQTQTSVSISIRSIEGGHAEFTVVDNGPGLSDESLSHLFEMQHKKTSHGEDTSRGLGIGLSICKVIVEAHDGWIQAENLPTGGAKFTFSLPLAWEDEHG